MTSASASVTSYLPPIACPLCNELVQLLTAKQLTYAVCEPVTPVQATPSDRLCCPNSSCGWCAVCDEISWHSVFGWTVRYTAGGRTTTLRFPLLTLQPEQPRPTTPNLYRARPVVIVAAQWYHGAQDVPGVCTCRNFAPHVHTANGNMVYLRDGDYVIAEADGEHYYPCIPEPFLNKYEWVGESKDA
jgi:hypothetical protein